MILRRAEGGSVSIYDNRGVKFHSISKGCHTFQCEALKNVPGSERLKCRKPCLSIASFYVHPLTKLHIEHLQETFTQKPFEDVGARTWRECNL